MSVSQRFAYNQKDSSVSRAPRKDPTSTSNDRTRLRTTPDLVMRGSESASSEERRSPQMLTREVLREDGGLWADDGGGEL